MVRTSVYVGVSVDGYIARLDGQVDFLDSAEPIDDDMGYREFMASIDILVMGRNTYDWVVTMIATNEDVDWPYGETPVMVLTHRALDVPPDLVDVVESTGLAPRELLAELRARGRRRRRSDPARQPGRQVLPAESGSGSPFGGRSRSRAGGNPGA